MFVPVSELVLKPLMFGSAPLHLTSTDRLLHEWAAPPLVLAADTRVNYGVEYDYTPAAIVRQVLLLPIQYQTLPGSAVHPAVSH